MDLDLSVIGAAKVRIPQKVIHPVAIELGTHQLSQYSAEMQAIIFKKLIIWFWDVFIDQTGHVNRVKQGKVLPYDSRDLAVGDDFDRVVLVIGLPFCILGVNLDLKVSNFRHLFFCRMGQGAMTGVVKEGRKPHRRTEAVPGLGILELVVSKNTVKGLSGEMADTKGVEEAGMSRPRKAVFAKSKLLNTPKSLKLGGFNDRDLSVGEVHGAMHRIFDFHASKR